MIVVRSGPHLGEALRAVGLALAVGVSLFAATYVGSATLSRLVAPQSRTAAPPESLQTGFVSDQTLSRTDREIGTLQERLRRGGDDPRSQTALGLAYLQKARETGDSSYYPRAEGLLQRANDQMPADADTLVGLGTIALARHDFLHALEWGQRAVAANPSKAAAYGVVGDAQVELGRYDEAVATVQEMVNRRPDQASYARVSYLRELHGDLSGAVEAMQLAVSAGAPGTEGTEWTRVQLGHLFFHGGDLAQAETAYREALTLLPGYVHALGGLGRVAAARGDYDAAIDLYLEATRSVPVPELVMQLAEIYRVSGRVEEATRHEQVVRALQQLSAASGMNTDLELALFDADYGDNLVDATQRLRALWDGGRQSVHVADALAWTLYRSGQCQEADAFARHALHLGTRDALMLYHAGRIAECAGDASGARVLLGNALHANPFFSLRHAPDAQQRLAALGKPVDVEATS